MAADLKHVKGGKEIAERLRELPKKIAKSHLRKAVLAAAYTVRDDARRRAVIDTGVLRDSIVVKFVSGQSDYSKITYFVLVLTGARASRKVRTLKSFDASVGRRVSYKMTGGDAYYWRFVEFGTYKMVAQPFMRPAFEANKDRAIGLIAAYLKEGMDQSARAFSKKFVVPN